MNKNTVSVSTRSDQDITQGETIQEESEGKKEKEGKIHGWVEPDRGQEE